MSYRSDLKFPFYAEIAAYRKIHTVHRQNTGATNLRGKPTAAEPLHQPRWLSFGTTSLCQQAKFTYQL
jgi:hypothetical protein